MSSFRSHSLPSPQEPVRSEEAKRANHNALERKRRIVQKERLQELKQKVPAIRGDRPSTVEVLVRSTEYIELLRRATQAQEHEIAQLRLLNQELLDRLGQATAASVVLPPDLAHDLKLAGTYAPTPAADAGGLGQAPAGADDSSLAVPPHQRTHKAPPQGLLSQSLPTQAVFASHERKRAARGDGEETVGRQRKISRSEAAEDMELAAEVGLFTNFCESVRRHSMSSAGIDSSPAPMAVDQGDDRDDGVFEMDMGEDGPHEPNRRPQQTGRRAGGSQADRRGHVTVAGHGQGGRGQLQGGAEGSVSSAEIDIVDASDTEDDEPTATLDGCPCGLGWTGGPMTLCTACRRWLHADCATTGGGYGCSQCRGGTLAAPNCPAGL